MDCTDWVFASVLVRGIPLTRYIASYYIAGGRPYYHLVKAWARQLIVNGEPLSEEEVKLIADCACNGKLEMQKNAKEFFKKFKSKKAMSRGIPDEDL